MNYNVNSVFRLFRGNIKVNYPFSYQITRFPGFTLNIVKYNKNTLCKKSSEFERKCAIGG